MRRLEGPCACVILISVAPLIGQGQLGLIHGRLRAVTDFPSLPAKIAKDVANRGCKIPQVQGVSGPHNAVRGRFTTAESRDWAVLCLKGNMSVILVYSNGLAKNPAELAPSDETITPSRYARRALAGTRSDSD